MALQLNLFIIFMSSVSANRSSMEQQGSPEGAGSSEVVEEGLLCLSKGESEQEGRQNAKNRRWSESQHILFIIFLQQNRQKIKSKLIRRSNSFFRDMSAFIQSKTSTQCRSYHQKYEAKYKFPHRIIRQEKQKIDLKLFDEIFAAKRSQLQGVESEMKQKREAESQLAVPRREKAAVTSSQCQTEIQGVSTVFIQQECVSSQGQQMSMMSIQPFMTPYSFLPPYYPHSFYQG